MANKRKQDFGVPALPKLPKLQVVPRVPLVRGPAGSSIKVDIGQPTEIPDWWKLEHPLGSDLEWLVDWGLRTRGLEPYVDYLYQDKAASEGYSLADLPAGSTVIDFLVIRDKPYLALFPEGEYWHMKDSGQLIRDREKYDLLRRAYGYDVVPMEGSLVRQNVLYVLDQALIYRRAIGFYAEDF